MSILDDYTKNNPLLSIRFEAASAFSPLADLNPKELLEVELGVIRCNSWEEVPERYRAMIEEAEQNRKTAQANPKPFTGPVI
jgi:hypothetical protein